MKARQIEQLDEKDKKIAESLISLGMNKNVAMALAYLQIMNSATSMDMERGANLRQPEVSVVMGQLKKQGWITEREDKKIRKGRPTKVYSLKVEFKDIITQLEDQQKKAV